MRWLIVEDALRDRKGHWFEYLGTFDRELRVLGDDVVILADRSAEPFLVENCKCSRCFPTPSGIAWATEQMRFAVTCACQSTHGRRIVP